MIIHDVTGIMGFARGELVMPGAGRRAVTLHGLVPPSAAAAVAAPPKSP